MSPLVSIVIPMHNAARHIEECLRSCKSQTYSNIEVIAVDDASTDMTVSVVKGYPFKRPLLLIRNISNKGTAGARNIGIQNARGKYIALLDADDMLTEDSVVSRVAILEKFQKVDICGGYTYVVGGNLAFKYAKHRHDGLRIRHGKFMQTSSVMLRRSVFETNLFDESIRLNEDREFWGRILVNMKGVAVRIARPMAYYRLHDSNKLSNASQEELGKAQTSGPITDITEPIHLINASRYL